MRQPNPAPLRAPDAAPVRPRRALPAPLRLALAGLLLAALGACAAGSGFVEQKVEQAEIDFQARHERVLRVVLLEPERTRLALENKRRLRREQARSKWEEVMARQRALAQELQRRRVGDREAFLRMLALQQRLQQGRERAQAERWAQFLEGRTPQAAEGPAPTPPVPGGEPAP